MSIVCPSCGEQNQPDARMCTMCGVVLQKANVTTQAVPPTPMMQQPMRQGYYGAPTSTYVVYAGFWLRFVAILIDGIVLAIPEYILGMLLGRSGAVITVANIALGWLYFAYMESSPSQGTLGKIALGLKVTDLDGNPIEFGQATGRHFCKIISGIILLIGYIMAGFTEKKQALHDIMTGCLVVKK